MFYQTFLSPQVKRSMIISNEHGKYELPNGLRLTILENYEKSLKTQNFIGLSPSAQSSSQNKFLEIKTFSLFAISHGK